MNTGDHTVAQDTRVMNYKQLSKIADVTYRDFARQAELVRSKLPLLEDKFGKGGEIEVFSSNTYGGPSKTLEIHWADSPFKTVEELKKHRTEIEECLNEFGFELSKRNPLALKQSSGTWMGGRPYAVIVVRQKLAE